MKCNVYDFDKTIFKKDSSVEFYKFCLKKKPSILKYVFAQLFYFILYLFSFINKTKFKEHVFVFLKSFDNIDELVKEFWEKNKKDIREFYIGRHEENDVVISASPYFLLKPICDELGIKHLIASDVDSKSGKFNKPNCYGKEKVIRLDAEFDDIEINEFFSDSYSDQPLADLANDPYIIKHDKIYKWNEYHPSLKERIKHRFFSKEFLAFLIVGFINTLNGVLFSYLFSLFIKNPVVAFFAGYAVSLSISYLLNSYLVFKSELGFRKYIKFCISYIPNFAIQNGLILTFYYGLHFHKLLVYALAAIIAIPITFLVLSLVTFKKGKSDSNSQDEISIPSVSFNIASIIIMTFAANVLICSLSFLFTGVITPVHLPASFIVASAIHFIYKGHKSPLTFLIEVCASLIIFVGFAMLMGNYYDASYDGNCYHKLAIGLLKHGWNPLYEVPNYELTTRVLGSELDIAPWVEGYCKGTWFFSASMYAVTGNIETGKCYNVILLVATFLAAYGVYRKRINNISAVILLSVATAFNPVLISQMFTFYIDGALYASLALLVMYLLVWLLDTKENKAYIFIIIGSAMVFCGNIKFTGLLLGGCFCIINFIAYVMKMFVDNKKQMPVSAVIKKIMPSFVAFAAIALITVVWAGSSAYVTNIIRHHTIGYPITGKDAIDIMTPNSPFTPDTNRFTCLFLSLFTKTSNFAYTSNIPINLKIPFTVEASELECLKDGYDIRLAGFGPLFSGVVILTACIFIYECVVGKKNYENLLLLANFVFCLVFVVAIKESWWARYAAYSYMAVLIVLYAALKDGKLTQPLFYIAIIALIILIANDALSFRIIEFNIKYSREMRVSLALAKQAHDIYAYNPVFAGSYFNLMDKGINFVIDPTIMDKPGLNVVSPIGTYWIRK